MLDVKIKYEGNWGMERLMCCEELWVEVVAFKKKDTVSRDGLIKGDTYPGFGCSTCEDLPSGECVSMWVKVLLFVGL